jgi:hypothetical protein
MTVKLMGLLKNGMELKACLARFLKTQNIKKEKWKKETQYYQLHR